MESPKIIGPTSPWEMWFYFPGSLWREAGRKRRAEDRKNWMLTGAQYDVTSCRDPPWRRRLRHLVTWPQEVTGSAAATEVTVNKNTMTSSSFSHKGAAAINTLNISSYWSLRLNEFHLWSRPRRTPLSFTPTEPTEPRQQLTNCNCSAGNVKLPPSFQACRSQQVSNRKPESVQSVSIRAAQQVNT